MCVSGLLVAAQSKRLVLCALHSIYWGSRNAHSLKTLTTLPRHSHTNRHTWQADTLLGGGCTILGHGCSRRTGIDGVALLSTCCALRGSVTKVCGWQQAVHAVEIAGGVV